MSSPNQLSFLPDDYLESKRQRRTNVICAVLFLIIMGVIGTAFTVVERSLRDAEATNESVNRQYAEAAKQIDQVKQMQEKQRKVAQQAELAASLLEKVPRGNLLAEITNSMPPGISLLDIALDSKVRQPVSAAPAGKSQFEMKKAAMEAAKAPPAPTVKAYDVTIKVTGMADTDVQVAQFIARLNQSKLLREVNLVISDEFKYAEAKVRKFQIEMAVDPSAQVVPGLANPRSAQATTELK